MIDINFNVNKLYVFISNIGLFSYNPDQYYNKLLRYYYNC